MALLRSEQGCPWDREQEHKSIRKNFIEETYEAVEAIDKEDLTLLREELGDVLLQLLILSLIHICQLSGDSAQPGHPLVPAHPADLRHGRGG